MIVRIVKLSLNPGRRSDFISEFDKVKDQIISFDGCRSTELLIDSPATGIVFTYSLWDSPQHLESYRQSDFFKNTWARVKPMFAAKAEAWTLNRHLQK